MTSCELCSNVGGQLVHEAQKFRVIRVLDANFPAFYRLIWAEHVAEFTDLNEADRWLCMQAVARIEEVLRRELLPSKINLATLGNVVPHLHWHVIARFDWDSHFPQPVWGAVQRVIEPAAVMRLSASLAQLDHSVVTALSAGLLNYTCQPT